MSVTRSPNYSHCLQFKNEKRRTGKRKKKMGRWEEEREKKGNPLFIDERT
jgi:hypothetical protein